LSNRGGSALPRRDIAGDWGEIGGELAGTGVPFVRPAQSQDVPAELVEECEALTRERFPWAVEKAEALAGGSGLSAEEFRAWYYGWRTGVGCVTFAVDGKGCSDGGALVGRNYHWLHMAAAWREVRTIRPRGALAFTSVTHHWCGHTDAMNEAGLCLFVSSLPQRAPERAGVPWHVLADAVLSTCRTPAEGTRLLLDAQHSRPFSYMLASGEEEATVVQATGGNILVQPAARGMTVTTNHELQAKRPITDRARSVRQLAFVADTIREAYGEVDERLAWRILSDHEHLICLGCHPDKGESGYSDDEWRTLWAMVVRPGECSMTVRVGQACTGFQETITGPGAGDAKVSHGQKRAR